MQSCYGKIIRDVPYARNGEDRAVGDLFLPLAPNRGKPVLLIHGGGWCAGSKEDVEYFLSIFLLAGRAVFSVNYRFIWQTPWPACGDDTLAAGHFLLDGDLTKYGLHNPEQIFVCGISAGGHLAMMTGLRLPCEKVEAIVSLAGPSRLDWVEAHHDPLGMHEDFLKRFFGQAVAFASLEMTEASPALAVKRLSHLPPPLFCLHSETDQLCPACYSEEAATAWRSMGGEAIVETFEGADHLHGFWINSDRESDFVRPEVFCFFARVFDQLAAKRI